MTESPRLADRQIRVFISSTFLDMHEERNVLVKRIFPQLRKMCEEREVTWTEVDLRWGITDEQKAEGKLLPYCLEEIRRCRPYFIGLLGERYGSLPGELPADLIERQPWLEQHRDKSITALEIIHGVLRDHHTPHHAYIYFRDPRFLESVPTDQRQNFTAENAESARKLARLKNEIRRSRDDGVCELRENYATPEKLGDLILEDFTKLIDRLYPKDQKPDQLDLEAARHEAYAQGRRLAFVGRKELLQQLNEHCAGPGTPLVLTGESGCGKSALLAEWAAHWRKNHHDDLVIQHYIGSTPDSADWQGLVRRILGELKRSFAIADEVPTMPHALRDAIGPWAAKAGGSRRVVLVFDGLNQLAEDRAAQHLAWLPTALPANFRVIVSALPGVSLEVLRERGCEIREIPLFMAEEIITAVTAFLEPYGRRQLPNETLVALVSSKAALNPLYLRTVLDELRQFGDKAKLSTKAAEYLSAPDLPELFDRVLSRWDQDFGQDAHCPSLVRLTLCLIACSRFGLSELELLELLGSHDESLLRGTWTPFYLAAENELVQRVGLLNFGHEYLRRATENRWLGDVEVALKFRLQIADYFERQPATSRKATELPWQLQHADERARLEGLLLTIPFFGLLRDTSQHELLRYWLWLGAEKEFGKLYLNSFKEWAENEKTRSRFTPQVIKVMIDLMAKRLGSFLLASEHFAEAEECMRIHGEEINGEQPLMALFPPPSPDSSRLLKIVEKSLHEDYNIDITPALSNLGALMQRTARPQEAEPFLEFALALEESRCGKDHPELIPHLLRLASLRQDANHLVEAEGLLRRALTIGLQTFGENDLIVAKVLNHLADILRCTNRLPEAESLLRRVIEIEERVGSDDSDLATALTDLAGLLINEERYAEAEPLLGRALEVLEEIYGPNHPDIAVTLGWLGRLRRNTNRRDEGEQALQRAVTILLKSTKRTGRIHPHLNTFAAQFVEIMMKGGRSERQAVATFDSLSHSLGLKLKFKINRSKAKKRKR